MSWLELSVRAPSELAQAVVAALEGAGAVAVSLTAAEADEVLEPAPGEQPLWLASIVSGLFEAARGASAVRAEVARALAGLGVGEPELRRLDDQDWTAAWRQAAEPREFANGLWVVSSAAAAPRGARAVVRLDPGLAFGTGAHPSTALCLEWLARGTLTGERVVDFGCGSGILAIAAARLGAREVVAVDHDPQALVATRANARANGVGAALCVLGTEDREALRAIGAADRLLANILANTLLELCDTLTGLLRPGGRLALSGILADQVERVAQRYRVAFDLDPWRIREGWVLLTGRKRRDAEGREEVGARCT